MSFFSKIRDFFTGNTMGDAGLKPTSSSSKLTIDDVYNNRTSGGNYTANTHSKLTIDNVFQNRMKGVDNTPIDNRTDSEGQNPYDNGSIWSAPKAGYEDTTGKYVYDKATHRFVYHKYNNVDNTHRQIDYYTKEIGENGGDLPEPEVNNIYERNPLQKIFAPIDSLGYGVGNLIKGAIEGDSLENTLSNAGKGVKAAFQDTQDAQNYRVGTKEIGQAIVDNSNKTEDQQLGNFLKDNLAAQIIGDTFINPTSYITGGFKAGTVLAKGSKILRPEEAIKDLEEAKRIVGVNAKPGDAQHLFNKTAKALGYMPDYKGVRLEVPFTNIGATIIPAKAIAAVADNPIGKAITLPFWLPNKFAGKFADAVKDSSIGELFAGEKNYKLTQLARQNPEKAMGYIYEKDSIFKKWGNLLYMGLSAVERNTKDLNKKMKGAEDQVLEAHEMAGSKVTNTKVTGTKEVGKEKNVQWSLKANSYRQKQIRLAEKDLEKQKAEIDKIKNSKNPEDTKIAAAMSKLLEKQNIRDEIEKLGGVETTEFASNLKHNGIEIGKDKADSIIADPLEWYGRTLQEAIKLVKEEMPDIPEIEAEITASKIKKIAENTISKIQITYPKYGQYLTKIDRSNLMKPLDEVAADTTNSIDKSFEGAAIYRGSGDYEEPVIITGYAGKGSDGEDYLRVQGSNSAVPASALRLPHDYELDKLNDYFRKQNILYTRPIKTSKEVMQEGEHIDYSDPDVMKALEDKIRKGEITNQFDPNRHYYYENRFAYKPVEEMSMKDAADEASQIEEELKQIRGQRSVYQRYLDGTIDNQNAINSIPKPSVKKGIKHATTEDINNAINESVKKNKNELLPEYKKEYEDLVKKLNIAEAQREMRLKELDYADLLPSPHGNVDIGEEWQGLKPVSKHYDYSQYGSTPYEIKFRAQKVDNIMKLRNELGMETTDDLKRKFFTMGDSEVNSEEGFLLQKRNRRFKLESNPMKLKYNGVDMDVNEYINKVYNELSKKRKDVMTKDEGMATLNPDNIKDLDNGGKYILGKVYESRMKTDSFVKNPEGKKLTKQQLKDEIKRWQKEYNRPDSYIEKNWDKVKRNAAKAIRKREGLRYLTDEERKLFYRIRQAYKDNPIISKLTDSDIEDAIGFMDSKDFEKLGKEANDKGQYNLYDYIANRSDKLRKSQEEMNAKKTFNPYYGLKGDYEARKYDSESWGNFYDKTRDLNTADERENERLLDAMTDELATKGLTNMDKASEIIDRYTSVKDGTILNQYLRRLLGADKIASNDIVPEMMNMEDTKKTIMDLLSDRAKNVTEGSSKKLNMLATDKQVAALNKSLYALKFNNVKAYNQLLKVISGLSRDNFSKTTGELAKILGTDSGFVSTKDHVLTRGQVNELFKDIHNAFSSKFNIESSNIMSYKPTALKRSVDVEKRVQEIAKNQKALAKENKLRQIKNGKLDENGNPVEKIIKPGSRDWHGDFTNDAEYEAIKPLTKNQREAVERGNNKGNALDNLLNKINNYQDEAAVDTIGKVKLTDKKPVNFNDNMVLSQQHYDDIMEELSMERTSLKKQIQFLEESPEMSVSQHNSWDKLRNELSKLEEDINVVKKHKLESDEYAKSKLQDKMNSFYKEKGATGNLGEMKGAYIFDTPYGRAIVDASANPADVNRVLDRYFENPKNITTNSTVHVVGSNDRSAYTVFDDGNNIYISSAMNGDAGWTLGLDDMSIGSDAAIHEGAHVGQTAVNPNVVKKAVINFTNTIKNMSYDEQAKIHSLIQSTGSKLKLSTLKKGFVSEYSKEYDETGKLFEENFSELTRIFNNKAAGVELQGRLPEVYRQVKDIMAKMPEKELKATVLKGKSVDDSLLKSVNRYKKIVGTVNAEKVEAYSAAKKRLEHLKDYNEEETRQMFRDYIDNASPKVKKAYEKLPEYNKLEEYLTETEEKTLIEEYPKQVQEIVKWLQSQFKDMAYSENIHEIANYLPHLINPNMDEIQKAKAAKILEEKGINIDAPFNLHALHRKMKGGEMGDTIKQINMYMKEHYDIDDFFDTSVSRLYLKRAINNQKFLYKKNVLDEHLRVFGHQISRSVDLQDMSRDDKVAHFTSKVMELGLDPQKAINDRGELDLHLLQEMYYDQITKMYADPNLVHFRLNPAYEKKSVRILSDGQVEQAYMNRNAMKEVIRDAANQATDDSVYDMLRDELDKPYVMLDNKAIKKEQLYQYTDEGTWFMDRNAYNMYQEVMDNQFKDQRNALVKAIAKFTNIFRVNATAINPSFHVNNSMGNVLQNWLDVGFQQFNPKVIWEAQKGVWASTHVGQGRIKKMWNGMTGDEFANMLREHGIIENGIFSEETKRFVMGEANNIENKSAVKDMLSKINPANTEKFAPYWIGRQVGNTIENTSRISNFIIHLMQGKSPEEAAYYTNHFLFDYNDLSDFEANTMKQFIPFYTWMRKNIPLQIEQIFKQPEKYIAMQSAMQNSQTPETDRQKLLKPDYLGNALHNPLGMLGDGTYINPNLPVNDLTKLSNWRDMYSSINPLVKLSAELASNKNIYYDSPIRKNEYTTVEVPDYLKGFVGDRVNPAIPYALKNLIPSTQKINWALTGDDANIQQWKSGMKKYTPDLDTSANIAMQKYLQRLKDYNTELNNRAKSNNQ